MDPGLDDDSFWFGARLSVNFNFSTAAWNEQLRQGVALHPHIGPVSVRQRPRDYESNEDADKQIAQTD